MVCLAAYNNVVVMILWLFFGMTCTGVTRMIRVHGFVVAPLVTNSAYKQQQQQRQSFANHPCMEQCSFSGLSLLLLHGSKEENAETNANEVGGAEAVVKEMFSNKNKEDGKKSAESNKQESEQPQDDDLPPWVRAIRQWRPINLRMNDNNIGNDSAEQIERDSSASLPKSFMGVDNVTSSMTDSAGWLLDPILRSLVNVQELWSGDDDSDNDPTRSNQGAPRNFLDLLDSDVTPSMESILDSLEGTALIINIPNTSSTTATASTTTSNASTTTVDQFWDDGWNRWDRWMMSMQQALSSNKTSATASNLTAAAEGILRQATSRLERFLPEAVTPATSSLQAIVEMTNATTALALAAAAERSLDLNGVAAERAQQLGNFAGQLKGVAEGLLRQGYVSAPLAMGEEMIGAASNATAQTKQPTNSNRTYRVATSAAAKKRGGALFQDFASASELDQYTPILGQAAEMAAMSGLIYEQTVPRARQLGHSIAAMGCSKNVKWMVTDSLASHSALELYKDRIDNDPSETPLLIRTITIRGFDAGDEEVDREKLVTQVCTANPEPLGKQFRHVKVHAGLWEIAKAIYEDVKQYIDWTTDQHKIILSGHSIGGSLANMVLYLLTLERGADFVEDRVLRVYTFGSPPVTALTGTAPTTTKRGKSSKASYSSLLRCDVLDALGLPQNLVWAFVQPWDPICRLFTDIDPLYPLIGDMGPGSDGVTPWPTGPPRTLRPVTKAILEAWEGWPRFRDTYYKTGSQVYSAVGLQHVLLPDPSKYLTDRFLTVSIAVPPVRSILRISANELYPALVTAFPLDVFEISYVPQAIRSFVHHFYPAYGFPFVEYVRWLEERAEPLLVRDNLSSAWSSTEKDIQKEGDQNIPTPKNGKNTGSEDDSSLWDSLASPWLSSPSRRESNATTTSTNR